MPQPPVQDFSGLLEGIRRNDYDAALLLRFRFQAGLRFFFARQPQTSLDIEGAIDHCLDSVGRTIRQSDPAQPVNLPSLVRTAMQAQIERRRAAAPPAPEAPVPAPSADFEKALATLPRKHHKVLHARYVLGHAPDQICHDARISRTEYDQLMQALRVRLASSR